MVTLHERPAVLVVAAVSGATTRDVGTGRAGVMMKATDVRTMLTSHGAIALVASALAGTVHGVLSTHCPVSQQLLVHVVRAEVVLMRLRLQLRRQVKH